jgi:hypothetical protein
MNEGLSHDELTMPQAGNLKNDIHMLLDELFMLVDWLC